MKNTEIWKQVTEFPDDYEVSDLGRVRSIPRRKFVVNKYGTVFERTYKSVLMKPYKNVARGGYLYVHLLNGGDKKSRSVHTLVAKAFLGPKMDGQEARHLDGNAENNAPANLVWGTRKENLGDKVAHGTIPFGEAHGRSVLSRAQIETIKIMAGKISQRKLAEQYGVCQQHVSNIQTGKRWKRG